MVVAHKPVDQCSYSGGEQQTEDETNLVCKPKMAEIQIWLETKVVCKSMLGWNQNRGKPSLVKIKGERKQDYSGKQKLLINNVWGEKIKDGKKLNFLHKSHLFHMSRKEKCNIYDGN